MTNVARIFNDCAAKIVRGLRTKDVKVEGLVESSLQEVFSPSNTELLLLHAFPPERFKSSDSVVDEFLGEILSFFHSSQDFLEKFFNKFRNSFKSLGVRLGLNNTEAYRCNKIGEPFGPLATAIKYKKPQAIRFMKLIGMDLALDKKDGNKYVSPLIYALKESDNNTVKAILEHIKTTVNFLSNFDIKNEHRTTPLILTLSYPGIEDRIGKFYSLHYFGKVDFSINDGKDFPLTALIRAYLEGKQHPERAHLYPDEEFTKDIIEEIFRETPDILNLKMPDSDVLVQYAVFNLFRNAGANRNDPVLQAILANYPLGS